MKKYYIISLTHTMRHEKFITLWRPNNAGYCFSKDMAGVYADPEEGYHDNEGNMPISTEDAERLFITDTKYWGEPKRVIPNGKAIWDILGVRMTRNGLERKLNSKTTILINKK